MAMVGCNDAMLALYVFLTAAVSLSPFHPVHVKMLPNRHNCGLYGLLQAWGRRGALAPFLMPAWGRGQRGKKTISRPYVMLYPNKLTGTLQSTR